MTARTPRIAIGKGLPNLAAQTLRFYRQVGVTEVVMPTRYGTVVRRRPLVPPAQTAALRAQPEPWCEAELRRIMDRIAAYDLVPSAINLPLSGNIVMGRPGRDADLDRVMANIRTAGRLGLSVVTYNFTALRASEGYAECPGAGRGGANLRDFDNSRIAALPPLPDVGRIGLAEMWSNLTYYLRAAVPVAEEVGVRLAVHPNDPPVPVYRGVAQPLADMDGWRHLLDAYDSSSNCLFFDTGVTTELGEDAPSAIREFGGRDRIAIVHYRNVRITTPRYAYLETFHEEGDCDIMACMEAFVEVGYRGLVDPDHTPGITDDSVDTRMGWAFAIGQLVTLRDVAMRRAGLA